MSYKNWIVLIAFFLFGAIALVTRPVMAGPASQIQYQTPTARPDGRVIYVVQENDSCLRIQLLTNTTIEQLRTFNKLDQNCTINPGQELLLMVMTPVVTATPNPAITATALLPTPTPFKGNGKICVVLFDDINGNAIHDEGEPVIGDSAVSMTSPSGNISKTGKTTGGPDPFCQDEMPEGQYNISMAVPGGYNATTMMNRPVSVMAGDQSILEFGVQVSTIQPPEQATPEENSNTLLAIIGGALILFGIGLAIYVFVFARR